MSDKGFTGSTFAIAQTTMLWTTLILPLHDVKHTSPGVDPVTASDIRYAEVVASGVSLSIAAVTSRMERTWTPFLMSALLLGILAVAYEYTLRGPGYSVDMSNVTPMRKSQENV